MAHLFEQRAENLCVHCTHYCRNMYVTVWKLMFIDTKQEAQTRVTLRDAEKDGEMLRH